ncbi:MAG TPA: hypothetical protein VMC83_13665 [Streptosporangiaceae bacterium]|nr:hypothetical protein [Streptosporangiaceae bacterium]
MGIAASSKLRAGTALAPPTRTPGRWRRGDVWAVAILIGLPVLVFGVPALLGHSVLPGDDLTQNFPLRVLAGRELRTGHLPLYDPYIWSGAPLLAGWNAGAAYPLTFLFAVLPATAAWTVNLIITWAVAGVGMFCFLRALRLGSLPSLLGGLSFAFAGAMSAQVSHFGLVAGMSWAPVALLSVLRLSETCTMSSRLRWIGVLAATTGLVILAGEPRAVDDACVTILIYAVWRVVRLGGAWRPAAVSIAAGAALGACLGAVQWLPGLAAVATSQRAAGSMALFDSGSLSAKWLLLMLVPDLLGGSGSFGQPAFFASYNLTEVTDYVGILPLVAAAVLLGRVRLRRRPPEWLVWHMIALVGVLLALGGRTPLGHLLIHLPLFGDQRLQSRNILVTDLALAVLLAYWASNPLTEKSRRFLRVRVFRRMDVETALGVLPPLAMITVVVLGLCWGAGLLRWLGVGLAATRVDGQLKPWLIPYALIGAAAIAFLILGRRVAPGLRSRLLAAFVVMDLIIFTILGVVAVDSGPGAGGSAGDHTKTAGDILSGQTSALAPGRAPAARPITALGLGGRFAIYDPDEIDARQLPILGSPDLNDIDGASSIQGYSSIVDGRYAAATGSHQAMGEGQDELSPKAVASGVLGQLDMAALLTVPAYLITSGGAAASPAPPGPPGTGDRDVAANGRTTWYFGTSLAVARLDVPAADARKAAGIRIGLQAPDGSTRWFRARAASASVLTIELPHPVAAVAVIGQAGGEPSRLGAPSVTEPGGTVFTADGQLQDALTAPQWGPAGRDGSFTVFVDHFAQTMFRLEALPGGSTSGASLRRVHEAVSATGSAAVAVRSPHGVRVVRSVAAIPGWTATWHPVDGTPAKLDVSQFGLVQAVDVPAGQGVLTWSYVSPGFRAGLVLSAVAAVALLALLAAARWPRLRIRRPERVLASRSLLGEPPAERETAGVS